MYSSFIFKCSQMEMTQTTLNCEWINTLWRIHTMEHYSAIKRANYQYLWQHEWIFFMATEQDPDWKDQ